MKLREFAKVADDFFVNDGYVVFACSECGSVKNVFYPDLERASVENLLDCEVISIGKTRSRISIDVVANDNDQKLEQIMHDIMKDCDEFLSYLESFKR